MPNKSPHCLEIRSILLFSAIAILLIVVIYGNTLKVPFVFDDIPSIVENNSLHWIKPLSISKMNQSLLSHRPLSNLTFGLNYYFGRLDTRGYHLVNIFLHFLNTLLLFYFLNLIFRMGLPEQAVEQSVYLASMTSLLWAASPLQTQAVNYVVQRMTLLACFFYLIGSITYIKARTSISPRNVYWFAFTIVMGTLALLSKENTVLFPITCLIIDYFFISKFQKQIFKQLFKAFAPYLVFGLVFVAIYLFYHPEIRNVFLHRSNSQMFTIWERIMTEWRVLVYYLSLLLFPHPNRLLLDYLYPLSKSLFHPASTIPSLLLVMALLGWAIRKCKLFPVVSFGIIWFFLNLLVESTIIPIDLIFEHRLYLPSVGFFMVVVMGGHSLYQRMERAQYQRICLGFFLILVLFEGLFSIERNKSWQNDITLFQEITQKYPDLYRAHISLAMIYQKRGILDKAEEEYRKAIQIRPAFPAIHNDYGTILWKQGNYEKAEEEFKRTIELDPGEPAPYVNLGKLYAETGKAELGIHEIESVIKIRPHERAFLALGELYEGQQRLEDAKQAYLKALDLNSKMADSFVHLGTLLIKTGEFKLAETFLRKGLSIDPESEALHQKLGIAYQSQSLLTEAFEEYIKTIELNPENRSVHFNIGSIFQQRGNLEMAVSEYEKGMGSIEPSEGLLLFKQAYDLTSDPGLQLRLTQLMKKVQK
jgi:Tfp pilus assembly protein PilF